MQSDAMRWNQTQRDHSLNRHLESGVDTAALAPDTYCLLSAIISSYNSFKNITTTKYRLNIP